MYSLSFSVVFVILCNIATGHREHEADFNFRVDPGTRTCFFVNGKPGQRMELYYEVINGQHGELDISMDILDPKGANIIADFKNSHNSIILDLEQDGDYSICVDNTYSLINFKLIYIYIVIEDKTEDKIQETTVGLVDNDGKEHKEEEIVEWMGTTVDGEDYTVDVGLIIDSLTLTMDNIIQARHILGLYKSSKIRDSYLAQEDTFVVDVWSSFQIVFMAIVGLIQVYTIKKLFNKPSYITK